MSRHTPGPEAIEAEMLRRLDATAKSICPSEVARGLEPENWRPLMHLVRQAAARLSVAGEVEILRKGKPIPPEAMHGVIRLRRKRPPAGGAGQGPAEGEA
ncbi:DUF3253 domain-containing protein [Sediminicoccus sp. BL-A-41-H5]|jgi:hypothetical protein|uniref:DUF3253 domain-containing protein n=1 Tax=Sediminicoccus sp. BL-A-41-H5 TaxID=3421106 RepID=UPI003D66FA64